MTQAEFDAWEAEQVALVQASLPPVNGSEQVADSSP